MTREEFSHNFRLAIERAHDLALVTVENELKPPFKYLVRLNSSYEGNPLAAGEAIPSEMRALGNECLGPLSSEEVINLLWRDKLVPEWIDVIPWEATVHGMTFQFTCCGRFAEAITLLYHEKEGFPPFHAPGVWQPNDWVSEEKSGRFDLNWHLKSKEKHP